MMMKNELPLCIDQRKINMAKTPKQSKQILLSYLLVTNYAIVSLYQLYILNM